MHFRTSICYSTTAIYILYSTLITGYENQVWMTLVTHGRTDCKLTAESFDLLSSCPYNSEEHKEYLNNFSPNPSKIWPRLDKFLKILLFFFPVSNCDK